MKRIIIFLGLFLIPFISISAQTTFISYDLPSDCYALQIGSFNNEISCLAAINGVYRSVNSGQNWSKVYGYPDSLINIRDISVINENTGFVVGEMNFKGLMLKTTDKGITWIRIPTPEINSFYGINFKGSKVCATGNNGKMLVSTNQGNNWTLFQNEFSVWFNDICDVIVTEDAIYSAYYDIKKTQDNVNWNYVYFGGNLFYGIAKTNNRLIAVGGNQENYPTLSYSDNDGVTWHDTELNTRGSFTRAELKNQNIGFACGNFSLSEGGYNNMIYQTTDGGITWQEIYNQYNSSSILRDISIINNQAFIVASHQIIRMTMDNPLPVELSSFSASVNNQNVTLKWSTASEINNSGFEIERSAHNSEWATIGSVQGYGTITSPKDYLYTDRELNTGDYKYRLKQIDYNGNYEYFDLQNEVVIGTPKQYNLSQNYPNPFNPVTKITYSIPSDGVVTLTVFDIAGKEITTLVNKYQTAGYYSVDFNASALSSGVYFYRFQTRDYKETKKMTLIK